MYIWQDERWPVFRWNSEQLLPRLTEARYRQGRFLGTIKTLGFDARQASELEATTEDVIKTSAIEGEILNPSSVRSSIAWRLGIPRGGLAPADRKVDGVVEMILDATRNFDRPLDAERLFGWHAALFPSGFSGNNRIDIGRWRSDRNGPMQVVSRVYSDRPVVHFEAPPADRLDAEVNRFIEWFNGDSLKLDGLLRAGLSHLWLVTIHPFDDGNGRIARAVADLAIAQLEGTGQRLYSMSSQIEREKTRYYDALERTQKGQLDVTAWLTTFTDIFVQAIHTAEVTADQVVARDSFWKAHAGGAPFSERQQKVLRKLLDGFEGHMTSGKWQKICDCSADAAQRDIADLVNRGILSRNPGGSKNTSYGFNWPKL